MVLTNAEIRPRPRPVSAITPDTPLHEVAINTWMCVERMVTPRQRRWRIGRAFCQRASPSPFSLEDPADTADSYACWTGENADEAAVGWTERVRQDRYPSHQLLDRVESAFWTPRQVAEYVDLLLEKADESWYPSLQLLDRIHKVLAMTAAASAEE